MELTIEILKLKLQQIQAQLALKRAQKKKMLSSTSTVQVPKSPSPGTLLQTFSYLVPVPVSPMRVVLGIDRGKKASEVSLKNPWKPPTESPTKPKATFADRLASVVRENKRKSAQHEERERKKAKTFSATALASSITNNETEEWCKYTGFNLRTRVVSQSTLKEEFKGKTTYSISDLYRLVVPPSYDPPEYDTADFLVTGIVASKSPVRQIKNRDEGGNYLVIKVTDLKVYTLKSVVNIDGH
jgi:minichromosome maintenance protein 10